MRMKGGKLHWMMLAGAIVSTSASAVTERDPWEGFNRGVYEFNDFLDRWMLRPVAKGYRKVTPDFIDDGITNVFSNVQDVRNLINSALQAKPESFSVSGSRIIFNTTFGCLGWFDIATRWDLQQRDEDFGQTLAVWGLDSGPFLTLPLFGPSSPRDAVGLAVDMFTSPLNWLVEPPESYGVTALNTVDRRADLIPAEEMIIGDRYAFIRDAHVQHREFLVNDGKMGADPFSEDDESLDDF